MKVKISDKKLWKNYLKWVSGTSVLVSLILAFVDFNQKTKWIIGIDYLVVLVALFVILWLIANEKARVSLKINNSTVNIFNGDIFYTERISLDFDAHSVTQSMDSSLNCSIKRSLKERLDVSKTFVLVVRSNTNSVRVGQCGYCSEYRTFYYSSPSCSHNRAIDDRSFIEYECEKAKDAGIKIVVLYNYLTVDRSKYPNAIRYTGTHLPMYYRGADGKEYWNYKSIKEAICG